MDSINSRIANELGVRPQQVAAAVALLDEGSTVPFIARYRKEVTGSLDDTQLRHLEERLRYLRELEERRAAILSSVAEQGKLTDELKAQLEEADTKTRLEDLYLPYRPKRRTKAMIAREAGLEPLALGQHRVERLVERRLAAGAGGLQVALALHVLGRDGQRLPLDRDRLAEVLLPDVQFPDLRLDGTPLRLHPGDRQLVVGWIDPNQQEIGRAHV